MLTLVCAFFGAVIAVNVTMAVLAIGSWTGLVVKNSYVASQLYNDTLMKARAQAALGWSSRLTYADGNLRFTVNTRDGTSLKGAMVGARLTRPVGTEHDRTVVLEEDRTGAYSRRIALAAGIWNIEVVAHGNAESPYRQIFRLYVPQVH
jgi:nitrogen fixation protein FixH